MKFRVLPGLPATGPLPEQFSCDGKGMHREGFVVEFLPEGQPSWVGNFQCGGTQCFEVLYHPDGTSLVVVAGGLTYVINPARRQLVHSVDGMVEMALVEPIIGLLLFCDSIRIEAWDRGGLKWCTRRISWDGIYDVHVDNGKLLGKSWSPIDEGDHPFCIDLVTGSVEGGAYPRNLPD